MNSRNIEARLRRLEKAVGTDKDMPNEERLNLKIPTYIKEYLKAAAYRESNASHIVSVTEYLCNLVIADMENHREDIDE